MAMWPGGRDGIAMSDPPDGKFRILRTHDFGRTWSVVPDAGMPPAGTAELGFAASGTCLVTAGHRRTTVRGRRRTPGTAVGPGSRAAISAVTVPAWPGLRARRTARGRHQRQRRDLRRRAHLDGVRDRPGGFDSIQCLPGGTCWASGADGRVGVLRR